jgi:diguanylate cyclase (GGDEF)-like protein
MSTLVDTLLNPLTLAFADQALEVDFWADDQAQSLVPIRLSLLAGLVLNGLMGLVDRALSPEAYRSLWVFRYALVCPIFGGLLLLSFAPFFRRFRGVILWVGAVSAGIGLILIGGAAPLVDSRLTLTFLGLHLIFCCLFLRLQFLTAAGLSVALGAIYSLIGWTTTTVPAGRLAENVLLLFSVALGLAAAYILDRSRRAEFLWRRRFDRQADELARAQEEAQQRRQEVDSLTQVDALTGLDTRGHFFEIAERDLERCRRYAHPLAIIMLDLDHFKVVNDTCGHATGDRVLQAVAGQIQVNVREADMAGRYGGEEFVVALPETDREAAQQVGERLRDFIESLRTDTTFGRLSVTVSVGIAATSAAETATLDEVLARADKALLAAKQAGRNRVIVSGA